jgi:AraC family transcriptional regulator of adaptative response/methylated-DNA-[protein]-cysteine methyltransferase
MDELDDVRWRAVESRDAHHDGVFVYGVRTTGVFCRPGCGSRRPLRRNVEYFADAAHAASAGYRACRRCRPDALEDVDPALRAVIQVCRRLEADEGESVADLASAVGYSERHLRRAFAELVGVSVGVYRRALRAPRTRDALRHAPAVTAAAMDAGYGSMRAFYEHGSRQLGMAPHRYRDGGRGERIRYTSVETPLGVVLVASTDRGVCSIQLGAEESVLTKGLFEEFPRALIERDDESLEEVAVVLAGAVRGEPGATRLPLDVEGTAFQIRVWEALRAIPAGETRTYGEIAAAIGAPRAVRAVGSACGANVVALAVPCHRVVRSDGSLGGYRWGVEKKAALLSSEHARDAS